MMKENRTALKASRSGSHDIVAKFIVSEINNFAYYNASGAVNAKTKSILAFTIIRMIEGYGGEEEG